MAESGAEAARGPARARERERVRVLGVGFDPMTRGEVLAEAARRVEEGEPGLFVTANLNYAMLCEGSSALREATDRAALVLADGMPIVWRSRGSIPERVAGSDLIFDLCELAARRGWGVFFLGGEEGVAAAAAAALAGRYAGLRVSGTLSPPFGDWDGETERGIVERVRDSGADLLFAALSQPRGELWLDRALGALGVKVAMQVGASLNFAAGRVDRAPAWMRRTGLEWLHRLALEPGRLGGRYGANGLFLARALIREARWSSGNPVSGNGIRVEGRGEGVED